MTGSARRLQREDLRESRVQIRGAPRGHPHSPSRLPIVPGKNASHLQRSPSNIPPPIRRAGSSGAQKSSHVPYIPTAMRASSSLPQSPSAPTAAEQNRQGEAVALQREAGLPIPWPPDLPPGQTSLKCCPGWLHPPQHTSVWPQPPSPLNQLQHH